jgi:guanine nucleotide-binding protein subunit alpha
MGNSISTKSKAIDKQLKIEKKRAGKEIKILLLGKTKKKKKKSTLKSRMIINNKIRCWRFW